jgi:tetratricopeptide (TPR) repeat protein
MASVAFKNVREDLRTAVSACRCRGLRVSAKWAAELLVHVSDRIEASGSSASSPTAAPPTPVCDDALLAKSYFDLGEYRRAAHALERYRFGRSEGYAAWDASSSSARKPYDATACFLRGYALFLAGEKRKEEERVEQASPLERFAVVNPHLKALDAELRALCVEDGAPAAADGFILYLYAVVLKARERPDEARAALVRAVNANPLIWSAWSDLAALCAEKDVVEALPLNDHWMVSFFRVQALLELQENDGAGMECDKLISIFGESPELVGLSARVEYNLRNFDAAQEKFEELFESLDPYRFEGLETYSNVLYVKEERAKLSHLAHRSLRNSKYRPETCCIIGNYYSLKSMHKRAVVYFKRALRLDRNCLSAWTLMGHEFVELKQVRSSFLLFALFFCLLTILCLPTSRRMRPLRRTVERSTSIRTTFELGTASAKRAFAFARARGRRGAVSVNIARSLRARSLPPPPPFCSPRAGTRSRKCCTTRFSTTERRARCARTTHACGSRWAAATRACTTRRSNERATRLPAGAGALRRRVPSACSRSSATRERSTTTRASTSRSSAWASCSRGAPRAVRCAPALRAHAARACIRAPPRRTRRWAPNGELSPLRRCCCNASSSAYALAHRHAHDQ